MKQANSCPICGRPRQPEFTPFCSRRCQEVDLGRWFTESYKVETTADSAASDEDV